MEQSHRKDTWASGAAYEPYVGRWSRLVAREFVAWLAIPQDARWLDIGCGTGALSQSILDVAAPRQITGIDPSEGYITFARQQVQDRRVSFRLGDAQALPEVPASYDAVVAGLVLNFVPQPSRAVAEMQRMARVGGDSCGVRLGLCSPDATDALLLGCSRGARSCRVHTG